MIRAITGATTVAAVIGAPVRHSLSPALHNAAFDAAGATAWRETTLLLDKAGSTV